MPRDLGDVLDYFLPPADRGSAGTPGRGDGRTPRATGVLPRAERPPALPILALPIGDGDVVRAAFAWNLVVETARLGASASLVAPAGPEPSLLWPDPGAGPVGAEVVLSRADRLADLHHCALDVAVGRAADAEQGGLVLLRVPPAWLRGAAEAGTMPRWVLLFTTPEPRDQLETFGIARRLLELQPQTRVGVTIHGARRIQEAEGAFQRVAEVAARRLGQRLLSYGMLVDDLHVYRAIVARRPIGLEHPQSRAARALGDVARLLLEDARSFARG